MRDLFLLILLPFLIYCCFKRPYLGLALWLWSSLVPVNIWAYGTATSIRWNMIFAACTVASYIFSKRTTNEKGPLFGLVLLFFAHATLSSVFHIGYDSHVWTEWEYMFKSVVFFIFVVLIVKKKNHFDALMWACALSVSARASIDGLKVLFSGGGHVVTGISSTFNDNNLSALAVLMCLPMLFYLYTQYKQYPLFKLGLIGLILTNVIFVFGSDSRGGFLGLIVLAGYFFLKSDKKLPILFGMTVVAAIALNFVDQAWFERMDSIKEADQDGSFMGRVISWKLAVILALENPILGGGFDAAAYGPTWSGLVQNFNLLSFISTPKPHTIHVAHSIYFQVIGDLGFVGFFLFIIILSKTHSIFTKSTKAFNDTDWLKQFCTFMALSIVAFAVSGAALSAAYNEIFFTLIGLAIVTKSYSVKTN